MIILRVVFKVGVLDDGDITAGMLQAGTDGSAFPAIGFMRIDNDHGIVDGMQDGLGIIKGSVVDKEDLVHQVGFFDFLIGGENGGFFVEDGNDDADFHIKDYK